MSNICHPLVLIVAKLPDEIRDKPGMGHEVTSHLAEDSSVQHAYESRVEEHPEIAGWEWGAEVIVARGESALGNQEMFERVQQATTRLTDAMRASAAR